MKKLYASSLLLTLLVVTTIKAQDIHFAQFDQAKIAVNPAMAGIHSDLAVTVHYRDQWKSISAPFKTYAVSVEGALFKKKRTDKAYLGVGMMVFSDKTGTVQFSTNQINLTANGIVPINALNRVSAGIQGGFTQRSINTAAAVWDPSTGGAETLPSTQYNYGDFSLGVHWDYGKDQGYISANNALKIHAGFASYHLNSPKQSFKIGSDKLFAKYVFHGGGEIGIKNSNVQLVPSFMYLSQGPSSELTLGMYIKYVLKEESKYTGYVKGASVSIGTYYRNRDAYIPVVLFEFGKYAIGMSYDVNISKLQAATNGKGGFEIMLRYRTPNPFLYQSRAQF